MNFAKVYSAQPTLLSAEIVTIEVDLSRGLHAFSVVGLPDKAVEESRDRMSSAIKHTGFTSPKSKNQKVVISLAPADLKKEGPMFDLPMALAYLLAAGDISFDPAGKLFVGELSLDGDLRKITGVLPVVREAKKRGYREVYVPRENAQEAALVEGISIFPTKNVRELLEHLAGKKVIAPQPKTKVTWKAPAQAIDLDDIKGQESAKRGLEIAAAGGHNIALYGPPGTGKTMLARALCHLLPPLSFDEVLEVTSIHSVAGRLEGELVTHPPFRSPHHTSSYVAIVGGGTFPKPGEATLAHRGVLFLDEFPEFDRRVIESLRQPLEERVISISRAKGTALFPARFILVAAMNPCPCGNYGTKKECVCMPSALLRYQRKVSGPIMDRIDMWIEVPNIAYERLAEKGTVEETKRVRERVAKARVEQKKRFEDAGLSLGLNSDMGPRELEKLSLLSDAMTKKLQHSAERLSLSPRAYHKVIKLARTIADLEGDDNIEEPHLLEAIQYRPKSLSV